MNHEPHIESACKSGRDLTDKEHFASKDIAEQIEELHLQWKELKVHY